MFSWSRRLGFVVLIALALAACGGGGDAAGPQALPAPVEPAPGTVGDGRLDELIEWARASQNAPALAVVVVRHGQVAERGAVGLRSADATVHVTLDDQWHLGSITKSMTSTLAALLVEDGLITWETRPIDVWPELANNIDQGFANATLKQFLSHSSGLKRDDDWSGASDGEIGRAHV